MTEKNSATENTGIIKVIRYNPRASALVDTFQHPLLDLQKKLHFDIVKQYYTFLHTIHSRSGARLSQKMLGKFFDGLIDLEETIVQYIKSDEGLLKGGEDPFSSDNKDALLQFIIDDKTITIDSLFDKMFAPTRRILDDPILSTVDKFKQVGTNHNQVESVILEPNEIDVITDNHEGSGQGAWSRVEGKAYDRASLLLSLLLSHGITPDQLHTFDGILEDNQKRKDGYVVVYIPSLDKSVFVCNQYREATYIIEGKVFEKQNDGSITALYPGWTKKMFQEEGAERITFTNTKEGIAHRLRKVEEKLILTQDMTLRDSVIGDINQSFLEKRLDIEMGIGEKIVPIDGKEYVWLSKIEGGYTGDFRHGGYVGPTSQSIYSKLNSRREIGFKLKGKIIRKKGSSNPIIVYPKDQVDSRLKEEYKTTPVKGVGISDSGICIIDGKEYVWVSKTDGGYVGSSGFSSSTVYRKFTWAGGLKRPGKYFSKGRGIKSIKVVSKEDVDKWMETLTPSK